MPRVRKWTNEDLEQMARSAMAKDLRSINKLLRADSSGLLPERESRKLVEYMKALATSRRASNAGSKAKKEDLAGFTEEELEKAIEAEKGKQ